MVWSTTKTCEVKEYHCTFGTTNFTFRHAAYLRYSASTRIQRTRPLPAESLLVYSRTQRFRALLNQTWKVCERTKEVEARVTMQMRRSTRDSRIIYIQLESAIHESSWTSPMRWRRSHMRPWAKFVKTTRHVTSSVVWHDIGVSKAELISRLHHDIVVYNSNRGSVLDHVRTLSDSCHWQNHWPTFLTTNTNNNKQERRIAPAGATIWIIGLLAR